MIKLFSILLQFCFNFASNFNLRRYNLVHRGGALPPATTVAEARMGWKVGQRQPFCTLVPSCIYFTNAHRAPKRFAW
jgi:hypothetical protein